MTSDKLVSVNLLAFVDQGEVGNDPYRIDRDGNPYVAVGDGGVVLGLRLGDSVFAHVGDHAAPGACVIHPSDDARHAVVGLSCIGNRVVVRTGDATGVEGVVFGKRGGGERVIVVFTQDVLRRLRPSDQVAIMSRGQGAEASVVGVTQMNITPEALALVPVRAVGDQLEVGVRVVLSSRTVGNGIGRPMAMWDVDLQIDSTAEETSELRLGDLVAITDLDARANAGFRKDWLSIGVVTHGASPQPGHGPGVTIVLSGPAKHFSVRSEGATHQGLREETLLSKAK
ncbi:MAG TPA: DUF4438 domain-containing protein [Acidimicrobiales bacterium]|jgi:hypothetical protein|nr:DUF4438 domain-containing protein [Acidimicrobiales bacterium]